MQNVPRLSARAATRADKYGESANLTGGQAAFWLRETVQRCYVQLMDANSNLADIFIGAAVEEWSERRLLQHALEKLELLSEPSVVLANFHLEGRQIDCVIATAGRVLVVEVKSSRFTVRGKIDGDWERLDASGQWRSFGNGYRQALNAKNRLRDAMRLRGNLGQFYPDAAVVFVEALPSESAVTTGDFKVAVTDAEQLDLSVRDRPGPWTLDDWRRFAEDLSLKRVSAGELLGGGKVEAAYDLIRGYRSSVAAELDRDGGHWLPENDDQRAEMLNALDAAPGCMIVGPSGCGKTLVAKWLGGQLAKDGECVIFVAAKDYAGSWSRLLRRELALTGRAKLPDFLRALRTTGCSVRIVLDGVNELGAARDLALRGLHALARRLDAKVIVTGQAAQPERLAALTTILISAPSLELKLRIAGEILPTAGAGIRDLLKAVKSGFEAAIVAEIGAGMPANASRQLLVDQFIRKRLAASARSGSIGLRRFAERLINTTTFSIGETAFDEMMIELSLEPGEIEAMFAAGILARRGGRVSFGHEILLNACAAYAFAQHAPAAGVKFAYLLAVPALEPIATDILSVIDDMALVRTILEATSDDALLSEAARGLAGPVAASVATDLLDDAEAALEAEIRGLRIAITAGNRPSVEWDKSSLQQWSEPETARIRALGREIGTGNRIDRYFELCGVMDAVLVEERRRLFDAATEAGITALKSESFRIAYSGFGQDSAFATLSQIAASGVYDVADNPTGNPSRNMMELTSGQLHFYLTRRRLFMDHVSSDDLADALAEAIPQRFRFEPYSVKLELMHAAMFARQASPEKLQALIEAIEGVDANRESLFISSAIVDALKFLGALDDSAEDARDGIRDQFIRATGEHEDEFILGLALTVSVAMFDHPYDYIYGDEFEALEPDRRQLVLRRALRAPDARKCVNLGWVIREVAKYGDPSDFGIMQEFATLPDARNGFPQEEWAAFTVATRFLGRHGLFLPDLYGDTDPQRALILLRSLLYASSGKAETISPDPFWHELEEVPAAAVIGCLSEIEGALREHHWSEAQGTVQPSLLKAYPAQFLALARRFLDSGEEANYFRMAHARDDGSNLAFVIIEAFGDRSDVARLQALAQSPRYARRALSALRTLDSA